MPFMYVYIIRYARIRARISDQLGETINMTAKVM